MTVLRPQHSSCNTIPLRDSEKSDSNRSKERKSGQANAAACMV